MTTTIAAPTTERQSVVKRERTGNFLMLGTETVTKTFDVQKLQDWLKWKKLNNQNRWSFNEFDTMLEHCITVQPDLCNEIFYSKDKAIAPSSVIGKATLERLLFSQEFIKNLSPEDSGKSHPVLDFKANEYFLQFDCGFSSFTFLSNRKLAKLQVGSEYEIIALKSYTKNWYKLNIPSINKKS